MNKPFRIRARRLIIKIVNTRTYLIRKNKDKKEIPIVAHPGKKESEETWSFHYPLSAYSEMLFDNGFCIEKIEEWISDKKSTGSKAKMEDRARKEFPLFMAIIARKN